MKKAFLIATLTAAAVTFNVAQAQNGLYLSLESGIAQQNGLPDQATVNASQVSTNYGPNTLRVGTGYNHDFNSRFGIGMDMALGRYGKTTYNYADGSNTEISASTLEFLATSTFHINRQFDVIAKAGGLRATPLVSGKYTPPKGTQILIEGAIEGVYNFNPHWAATLTYAHVFGNKIENISDLGDSAPGMDEALLGLRYTFGS